MGMRRVAYSEESRGVGLFTDNKPQMLNRVARSKRRLSDGHAAGFNTPARSPSQLKETLSGLQNGRVCLPHFRQLILPCQLIIFAEHSQFGV